MKTTLTWHERQNLPDTDYTLKNGISVKSVEFAVREKWIKWPSITLLLFFPCFWIARRQVDLHTKLTLCPKSFRLVGWWLIILFGRVQFNWAPSSEFVSSSIPSWQILTAHAEPFRGARDLAFCLKVPPDSLLVRVSSECSGETAWMRRLAWTFAARIGDKYQIRLTRSNYCRLVDTSCSVLGRVN